MAPGLAEATREMVTVDLGRIGGPERRGRVRRRQALIRLAAATAPRPASTELWQPGPGVFR